MSDLSTMLDRFAEALASRVVDRLASTSRGMVSQHGSPLGARRHRAAVARRLERGEGGAARVGRRFLLSHDALTEELARVSTPEPPAVRARDADLDEYQREIVRGLRSIREVR